MTTVFIYFKHKEEPVSFNARGTVSQVSNEILRLMRTNQFFPVQTENGAIILQSEEVAGLYFEKD